MNQEAGWHVYLLQSEKDGTFYTGMAIDVFLRLKQHNEGRGAKYTRGRCPWKVAWKSIKMKCPEAARLERKIKRMTRKKKEEWCL